MIDANIRISCHTWAGEQRMKSLRLQSNFPLPTLIHQPLGHSSWWPPCFDGYFLESLYAYQTHLLSSKTSLTSRPFKVKLSPYFWSFLTSSSCILCSFSSPIVVVAVQSLSCVWLLGTPGFPVLHYLLEFSQTHVHWVDDAIQLCHPLSSPSPPALNLSQHQGLFQWVGSLHQVAKVFFTHLTINLYWA